MKLGCPWSERVAEMIDASSDIALESHVAGCQACQELLTGLRQDQLLLRTPPEIAEDELWGLHTAVTRRLASQRRQRQSLVLALTAALLLCVIGISLTRLQPVEPLSYSPPKPQGAANALARTQGAAPRPARHARPARNHNARRLSPDRLMLQLGALLAPPSDAPVSSDAAVVMTASTEDPDVILIFIAETKGGDTNE